MRKEIPSNNSKYTPEIREQTAGYILENGKSVTSVAEEMGIDTNTVCKWVREYRRKNNLPSCAEEKGIKKRVLETEEISLSEWHICRGNCSDDPNSFLSTIKSADTH